MLLKPFTSSLLAKTQREGKKMRILGKQSGVSFTYKVFIVPSRDILMGSYDAKVISMIPVYITYAFEFNLQVHEY